MGKTQMQQLIDDYESTYNVDEKIRFEPPANPLVDDWMVGELKAIYEKMKTQKCDWWMVITAPEGFGKCQPAGSKVLMANGEWKNVEDIRNGDIVISPQEDGSYIFATVRGTTSWFSNENYDVVELNRNARKLYSCSSNHPIPLNVPVRHRSRIGGKHISLASQSWKMLNVCAKDYHKWSTCKKTNATSVTAFPIPFFKGQNNCVIEPYTLGVWLGDGCFVKSSLGITTSDIAIISEIKKYYDIMSIHKDKRTANTANYTFSTVGRLGVALKMAGLYEKRSGDKFIPRDALLSDIDYRKRLLAGLIDTDGYMSKGGYYSITTKSEQLAKDIEHLIYSLGGRCTIHKIRKGIKRLKFIGEYFHVQLYLGNIVLPLQVARKIRNDKFFYLSANRVAIDVKCSESAVVYGFDIDSPSHWYITDNWMVTHNTSLAIAILWEWSKIVGIDFADAINDNIAFDEMDVLHVMRTFSKQRKEGVSKRFYPWWFDEGANVFQNRDSHSGTRIVFLKYANAMRFFGRFIILCTTEFRQLDIYLREHRVKSLIRIERQGVYHYYNNDQMNWITFKNKGLRDVHMKWNVTSSQHAGKFSYCESIDNVINNMKNQYFARLDMVIESLYTRLLIKSLAQREVIRELGKESVVEYDSGADSEKSDEEKTDE